MKKMVQNKAFAWMLGIFLIVMFSGHSQAWIKFNWVDIGFDESDHDEIEELIITSASHFLQSYSRMLEVFKELEQQRLQPLNMSALLSLLDESFISMERARNAYLQFYQKALHTPYDAVVINLIMTFDYSAFPTGHHPGSRSEANVIDSLKRGGIREVIGSAWLESEKILDSITFFRHSLQNRSVPAVEFLWELNRQYADSLMTGQQVARIFHEIAGK